MRVHSRFVRPLRHQLRALLLALLLMLVPGGGWPTTTTSSGGQLHFEQIGEMQGLFTRTLTCGLQDRFGFLWFGSEDGLIRYDGYTFKEFVFDPADPRSLSSNLVYALLEDRQGNLWVGTVGGGLNRYDRDTGGFVRYQHDPNTPQSLSHNGVVSLLEDSSGNLWIGTEGGGLNRLAPDRQTFIRYNHDPKKQESLANDTVWHLYEDSRKRVWIGTFGGGLDLYQPETDSFSHYRHQENNPSTLSSNTIGAIFEDSAGRLWIGSTNAGLNLFDPATGQAIRYQHNPAEPTSLGHNHIWTVHEADNGLLWLTSFGGGLMLFDPATGRSLNYQHNPAVDTSLSSDLVWFLLKSKDDIFWLGTDGGGLNKLVERAAQFNHLLTDAKQPQSLSHDGINGIAEGRDGRLWLANDGGGFQYLDRRNQRSRNFRHEEGSANTLVSDLAEAILVDHLGVVWIGTYGGLSSYNPITGIFHNFLHEPNTVHSLSDNRIWALHEDSHGNLWVGTRDGLNRISPERSSITRLMHHPDQPESLSDNGIWTIFEDSRQTLWVGTDNGLNRMRPDGRSFDRFFANPEDAASLSHNNITAIHEDRKGNLWVGTNGGLNRLAPGSDRFEQFNIADGLGGNSIRAILEDDQGMLWITTARSLICYNPEAGHFESYDKSDGLQGSEFSRAALRTSTGEMVIGGRDGINVFDPAAITRNQHVPPIWLTEIHIHGRETILTNPATPQPVFLDYSDSAVTFEFTALDYSNPGRNSYAYMLEGFDRDWVQGGEHHTATYTNLDGGSYVFRVKGANNHGLWNDQGAALQVFVTTPPWLRWWAFLGYALLAAGSIYSFIAFKESQHRQRLAAVQQINEELQIEIEERHKAEQALQESEKRLSMALEASQQGIWEFYPQSGKTYFSHTWFAMLGYVPGSFPNSYETWAKLLHPDDRPGAEQFITEFLQTRSKSFNIEFRMRASDGSYRWIQAAGKSFAADDTGNITHISGIHLDITERKEWLQMIEASERRYRELFDEAPVMYVILENREDKAWIRDANNTFTATLGYRREEVIDTLLSTYYAPASRLHIAGKNNYEQIVNRTFEPEERQLLTKDGRVVTCLLHASPEVAGDTTGTAIRAMFLDVTAKKLAEEEKLRLENALHQAQKLEAIGTLAGGIAHDFNNILAAIIGYSELLLLESAEDTPSHARVKQIRLAGLRAKDLVQQILTFSRKNDPRLETMQAPPVIREALLLLRSTLPKSITIREAFGEALPNITANPTQVHQIVMNLCTNSAQAMPEGGTIRLDLDAVLLPENSPLLLPHQQPGHYLRLVIRDDGEGIPVDILQNIFTPYFTTKAKANGTGLGLAVVHGIVQSYQGVIDVQSSPGRGTTFTVMIPATQEQVVPEDPEVGILRGRGQHILLVDDEPMLVDIGRQMLLSLGYRVTTASSSSEALALFQAAPDRYDMLVSDMAMPDLTGERLARQFKSLRPDLPVILLTGFSEKLQGRSREELGIEDLLYKPMNTADLAAAIHSAFNRDRAPDR